MQPHAAGHPLRTVSSDPDEPETRGETPTVGLALDGELDMAAAFRMEHEADRLLARRGADRLVVDLAAVTFVDSAGLGALLAIRDRSRELGIEFALVNPSAPVRRMLELSGTSGLLAD